MRFLSWTKLLFLLTENQFQIWSYFSQTNPSSKRSFYFWSTHSFKRLKPKTVRIESLKSFRISNWKPTKKWRFIRDKLISLRKWFKRKESWLVDGKFYTKRKFKRFKSFSSRVRKVWWKTIFKRVKSAVIWSITKSSFISSKRKTLNWKNNWLKSFRKKLRKII